MTPQEFIDKWATNERTERAASQSHFNDLCELLQHPKPLDVDRDGTEFTFEKGATTLTGGDGFADVWKKHCFAWEYKGRRADLTAAYAQLKRYADALDNPPLLIVSDMRTIIIHTAFTNAVKQSYEIGLHDMLDSRKRELLRWAFTEPERLRPGRTRRMVTEEAANKFTRLAHSLRQRGHDPQAVAHFLDRLVFCMFAEDVGLLPGNIFTQIIHGCVERPEGFVARVSQLFAAMVNGGDLVIVNIPWFNGGLFNDATVLPLEPAEIRILRESVDLDWSSIDPTIFGTLFERGLDPDKRSQLGAQYTDPDTIMRLVRPVLTEPLTAEWEAEKAAIADVLRKRGGQAKARKRLACFLDRLSKFRVLDPACGSGNFLYLSLREIKNLEKRVVIEAEAMGLHPEMLIGVGPEAVLGIEINPYAAELARVAIWIGELQWRVENGYQRPPEPILKPLDQIECRDAIINSDGTEPSWPKANVIVGNPPFLGGKMLRSALGDDYVDGVFALYEGRVPAEADLVTYWFEKAAAQIAESGCARAGLVATNSVRGGASRRVLERVVARATIYEAWSDEDWINEGAAVRVSLIAFSGQPIATRKLDGVEVEGISTDLRPLGHGRVDLTRSVPLAENQDCCYMGVTKVGPFDIPGSTARAWLSMPNPHGRPNSDVLRPSWNGMDVTRRPRDQWIVDFGVDMSEIDAACYEAPFSHVRDTVKPMRATNNRESYREYWWLHGETRPSLRGWLGRLARAIVTPEVSKHRVFVWLPLGVLPDKNLHVIVRDDDVTFGVLSSRAHELWALRQGSSLEDRPRYTPSTTFETFPFPTGLTPDRPAAIYANDPMAQRIAAAAARLNALREGWLNPPEFVDRVPELVAGYSDRIVPKSPAAAQQLKARTLTNLYNTNPPWLQLAHRELDESVAAAYGWAWPLPDDEVLARLFKLNQERPAAAQ